MSCQALLPEVLDMAFVLRGPTGLGWELSPAKGDEVCVGAESAPIKVAEPIALVALAAWATRLWKSGRRIRILDNLKSPFTWEVGLLKALANKTPRSSEITHADGLFPLCQTYGGPDLNNLSDNAGILLNVPEPDARPAFVYTLKEMVRNSYEHSHADMAFFAGSYVKKRGRVTFAVADSGIGIRASLARQTLVEPSHTDAQAIERALQPRVTGADMSGDEWGASQNAGLGLFMTRRIVQLSKGEFIVHSCKANFHEHAQEANFTENPATWKGTIVQVTIMPAQMTSFPAMFQSITTRDMGTKWPLQFESGPADSLILEIPIDATGFAADKDWGIENAAEIRETIRSGGHVRIDFAKAKYTTQSAMHALLFDGIRLSGPKALKFLWFSNAGSQIRAVLNHVASYTLEGR